MYRVGKIPFPPHSAGMTWMALWLSRIMKDKHTDPIER